AGIQSSRIPSSRQMITSIYQSSADEFLRLSTVSVDRIRGLMNRYARDTGKTLNVSPEAMVEAVRGNRIKTVVTEMPFLKHMFKHAGILANVVTGLSWEFLVSSTDRGFILCDDPMVIVPPRGGNNIGLLIPGSVKYFPLTRNLCLRMIGPG